MDKILDMFSKWESYQQFWMVVIFLIVFMSPIMAFIYMIRVFLCGYPPPRKSWLDEENEE